MFMTSGVGGGYRAIDQKTLSNSSSAGREDAGALVDLGGIEQVEHGKVLHIQDFVHAFKAEAAFAIEEVGDVSLLETGLLRRGEGR